MYMLVRTDVKVIKLIENCIHVLFYLKHVLIFAPRCATSSDGVMK